MSTTFKITLLLLSLIMLQGCGDDAAPARDFIERQAYSESNELVSSAKSESGKTEVHYRLESDEAEKNVFIRLDIGDFHSIQGISGRKGSSTTLYFQEGGSAYVFDPRDLFDRAVEMHGKLFPIEQFERPNG